MSKQISFLKAVFSTFDCKEFYVIKHTLTHLIMELLYLEVLPLKQVFSPRGEIKRGVKDTIHGTGAVLILCRTRSGICLITDSHCSQIIKKNIFSSNR